MVVIVLALITHRITEYSVGFLQGTFSIIVFVALIVRTILAASDVNYEYDRHALGISVSTLIMEREIAINLSKLRELRIKHKKVL